MSGFAPKGMKGRNKKGLALNSAPAPAPVAFSNDLPLPDSSGSQSREEPLEIGAEFKLDLQAEDLIILKDLGAGNGGSVSKVQHNATKAIMARKIIHVEAKPEIRKRIVRELGIMHECNSPYIVSFYGAFMNPSGDVVMCMEYADVGSLDAISKNFGPIRIDVLGKISEAILGGLTYLYSAHRIMHRDIKPSNVLVNSKGNIKLCDFGVSSELENSVADTFVGTGTYMAPERISGSPYTVKSDVWSVGLTLMELAIGKFPFSSDNEDDEYDDGPGPQSILDLLQQIVMEPSPQLPKSDAFPQILDDMISRCLLKAPEERPTPRQLFENDPFIAAAKRTPVDLQAWANSLLDRNNGPTHLPQSQQLNQSQPMTSPQYASTASYSPTSRSSSSRAQSAAATPTSQDIPFSGLSLQDRDDQHDAYESRYDSKPLYSANPTSSSSKGISNHPARTSSSHRLNQPQDRYSYDDYQSQSDRERRQQYPPKKAAPPNQPLPQSPSGGSNGTAEPRFRAYPPGL